MKYKDICKNYGTKFVFDSDMPPYPYMVIDDSSGKGYCQIVGLSNGKTVYGFTDQDSIMENDVTIIKEIINEKR